ncbi:MULTISPECIES: extracellular solute-binding protein [Paenibacillus]|uniref:ABC transporter substrate-binding protein n=1 Tax=Paenibacillus TaxID=44249 RepID=UPI0007BF2F65|nr:MULTISPECIES: extracellular solute-binding protein [Paenibacillus]WDQ31243.1 extracellular solute-binding protein [Paenibacillus marchantiae]SLJ88832.1 carbohydrate ABC transporter substrate-binding protein, CUT1 family [Paenibacillus sp. RU5A]SOC61536.1 carbohydrate ABC transporter substrate-binding protein, CUT1 family [Paenibacillus sp. RU26A]SOC68429.1 carbohydrate ABC transporter substrate-binding protein, CUT1 family [Paenibacillus sp. RU5M]
MKYRNWLKAALITTLTASMLSACGGANNEGASAGSANQNAGETINLTLWGAVPAEAGPQEVIDSWNKENPDIQVEYFRYVNDDPGNLKLDTALMTGQDADLFVNYTLNRLQKRVDAGVALDLSSRTDYNIDEQMGVDAAQWKIGDKYYGIPTKKNMLFIWLNKSMLDEAGLPIPPVDWTWDDLREYAKALTKSNVYGLMQHDAAFTAAIDGTIAGLGVTTAEGTSNFNNDLWKKQLQIVHDMMFVDKSTPEYGEQVTSKMPVDTMFLKGEAAMLAAGEFIFRNANNLKDFPHDFKIAFATIPKVSADQKDYKYAGGLGDMLSVNAKSKHQDAAWKFAKWYADGGMLPMASGGRLPSSKSVDNKQAMDLLLKGVEDKYDTESMNSVVFGEFPSFQLNVPQQALDARKEEYEKYFLNEQDIDTTLKNMAKRHQEYIK